MRAACFLTKTKAGTHNIQTRQLCIVSLLVFQGECQIILSHCLTLIVLMWRIG